MSFVFPRRQGPLLFAHRGASQLAPENTLQAFELAVNLGDVDVLEMDAHMTADGHIVVIHDATLERTTDGHGLVRTHTLGELQQLDAGAKFTTVHQEMPFQGRGVVIPLLEDVLRAFPNVGFNIEIKQDSPEMIPRVLDLLSRTGTHEVVLAAAEHHIMQQLEAAKPGCPLGMSSVQAWHVFKAGFFGRIPEAWRHRALQVPPRYRGFPVVSTRTIRRAHAAGLDVHLWTINDPVEARKWLDRGVDGVMSDNPSLIAPAFARPNAPDRNFSQTHVPR